MNNSLPIRVGLLLCDDVDEAAQAQYGTYTEMFRNGLQVADSALHLSPIHCAHGEFPDCVDDFAAYIISGSRQAVYAPLEWVARLQDFVRECQKQRKKTVGICFGHQLIAHALGGETRKAEVGWGLGIHRARIIRPQTWMRDSPLPPSYNLVVLHQDQIVSKPRGCQVIAENDFCPVSMLVVDDVMLGIQGHPEFDKEFCTYRIHSRRDRLSAELYQQSLASLEQMELDSARVLSWVARFIRSEPNE